MALINCPDCGRKVSDLAVSCPECGYPISKYIEDQKEKQRLAEAKLEEQRLAEISRLENERKQKAREKAIAEKKKAKKKARIILLIALISLSIAIYISFLLLYKRPYEAALPDYLSAKNAYDTVVSDYFTFSQQFSSKNRELENKIEEVNAVIYSGEKPYNEDCLTAAINCVSSAKATIKQLPDNPITLKEEHAQSYNAFKVRQMQREITSLSNETQRITDIINKYPIPDYSKTILDLDNSKTVLERSYQQYKQVTNPPESFIIDRITDLPGVNLLEAATESHDPNGLLHKDGGYTSAVYFISEWVTDSYTISTSPSPVDRGTNGGGCIEVFKTADEAQKRNAYLSSYDGTVMDTGSHTVIGSILIRTSHFLTATQQDTIEAYIINSLLEMR